MGYTKSEVTKISIVQIILGGLLIILAGVCSGICLVKQFSVLFLLSDVGSGYWTSVLCLITGIIGASVAYKDKLMSMSVLYFVMNIILIIAACISLGFECWGVYLEWVFLTIYFGGTLGLRTLIVYIFVVVMIFVILIIGCVGACLKCCGHSEAIVHNVTTVTGQIPPTGIVVLSTQYQQQPPVGSVPYNNIPNQTYNNQAPPPNYVGPSQPSAFVDTKQ